MNRTTCTNNFFLVFPASRAFAVVLAILAWSRPAAVAGDGESRELIRAAQEGDLETVRMICDAGAHLDRTYYSASKQESGTYYRPGPPSFTALGEAAANGRVAVVRELIKRGADVNHRNTLRIFHLPGGSRVIEEDERTPLVLAAVNGHEKVVRILLDAGGDPRSRSRALFEAVSKGDAECVRMLANATRDRAVLETARSLADDKAPREIRAALENALADFQGDVPTPPPGVDSSENRSKRAAPEENAPGAAAMPVSCRRERGGANIEDYAARVNIEAVVWDAEVPSIVVNGFDILDQGDSIALEVNGRIRKLRVSEITAGYVRFEMDGQSIKKSTGMLLDEERGAN
jgi:hypothetical protein